MAESTFLGTSVVAGACPGNDGSQADVVSRWMASGTTTFGAIFAPASFIMPAVNEILESNPPPDA